MTNGKFRGIIKQYQKIIAEDGEVTEEELESWLLLDEELPEEYRTTEYIKKIIISNILYPTKLSKVKIMAQRMKLYNLGMTDSEIAGIQGFKCMEISSWRKENNLKPIKKVSKKERERMALYNQGLSDSEIARIQDVAFSTIRDWRKKNNLESNTWINRKENHVERLALYNQGLTDAEIAGILKVERHVINSWRSNNNLERNKKSTREK